MNLFGTRSYGPLNNGSPKPGYDHVNNPWSEAETTRPQKKYGLGTQIERITTVIGRITARVKQIVANEFTLRERCVLFIFDCAVSDGIKGVIGRKLAAIFMDQKVSKISTADSVEAAYEDDFANGKLLLGR
jgi:hypothetical protein